MQNDGWLENATVSVDDFGKISSISPADIPDAVSINGYAIPAFQNAHSHSFQYAIAGLAENHSLDDDFWSWREMMYSLALHLDPDEIKNIAVMLYSEMVRNGYSNVAEFHYLHHDKSGLPYSNLAETSEALIEAANEAGIKITLIPIFYQKGGFGIEPNERQQRFICKTVDDYLKLFADVAKVCEKHANANLGAGIHSLRAVKITDILNTVENLPRDIPFHLHISEQLKEVEDCLNFMGKRPVEWLLENIDLNERFHLVHATHLTAAETESLAAAKANVVICPSTEGNLGDGIFPLHKYQEFNGNWSIGTDSHIGLNPFEELRLLDYGQRLISHKRNTFPEDAGLFALSKSIVAGRKAMNNFSADFFAVGKDFDACIINADSPLLGAVSLKNLASVIVYTADSSQIYGTFNNGKFFESTRENQNIKAKFGETVRRFRRSSN